MPGPLAIAGLSLLGGVATNIWNASEARKNRQFQERMSSTAHQREVADLRAANVNSAWRSMSGASAPGGDRAQMEDVVGKGVSSAMAAKQMQAQLELTRAQTDREKMSGLLLQQQRFDLTGNPQGGAGRAAVSAAELSELSVQERRQLVPLAYERARAEISQLSSSAEAARARGALDRLAAAGAINEAEFQKMIGEAGPAMKFFLQLLRMIR